MWGICLDSELMQEGLFQTVVECEMDSELGKANILRPKEKQGVASEKIRNLTLAPKFVYGEQVIFGNHPDIMGTITYIYWHFDKECFYYKVKVGEHIKSKRFYEEDLERVCKSEGDQ
uniref:hypothetical protein n=1 Tax=Acetatifactor sp. TaxID=1872090 RepID=UPI004055DB87